MRSASISRILEPSPQGLISSVYIWVLVHAAFSNLFCSCNFVITIFFFLVQSAIIQFSVIMKSVVPKVVKQWLDRHQTRVKESSGSGQAIIRQWLGNQLGIQFTIVHSVSDI